MSSDLSDQSQQHPLSVWYEGREVRPLSNETVLDALIRAGINTPFSCKGGSCLTCMLQCAEGQIPAKAQRALGEPLRKKGYFLPCQCVPTTTMWIRSHHPQDIITRCMLIETDGHDSGTLRIQFEVSGNFKYRVGQIVTLVTGQMPEPRLTLASDPESPFVEVQWALQDGQQIPEWLGKDAEFGVEFGVRGPFDPEYDEIPETEMPGENPALWAELDDGKKVRAALEDFYTRVYDDPLLAPYFHNITKEHIIGKQYSFLQKRMTGRDVYWGDTVRNVHHWMVISQDLFDYRQKLMKDTLRDQGLTERQIEAWDQYEEPFRGDIVKSRAWPKRIGNKLVDLEGFDTLTLDSGTVCDSCGAEVSEGTTIRYHRRTGKISCPQCTPTDASVAA